MAYQLEADHVYSFDDEDMVMVGFADDRVNPSRYVILQKSKTCAEQDRQLGLDQIHIEVEDQSRSTYGGIKSINLEDDQLIIAITQEARMALNIDGDIEIKVNPSDSTITKTLALLETIAKSEL